MKKLLSFLLAVILVVSMTGIMVAAESANQAYIRVGGADADGKPKQIDVIVTEGGEAKYLLTDENGVATEEGANADNYNVKFEYPTGGPATLYLKGANLKTQYDICAVEFGTTSFDAHDIKDFDAKIVTETESTLTGCQHPTENAGYSAIAFRNRGTVTITGPGKLNLYSESAYCIITSAKTELTIKDANIYAEEQVVGDRRPVIWAKNNLIIDNSNVELKNGEGGSCLYNSVDVYTFGGDPCDIIIKNNSKVKMSTDSYQPAVSSTGTFKIDNSDVEITALGKCFNVAPKLEGVGALGGTKVSNATAYSEKKATSYAYFKCGSDLVVPTTTPEATLPAVTQPATQATQATEATQAATKPTQAATQATQAGTQATQPVVDNAEEKDNGLRNAILIIILVVVLACAGLVTYMIIQNKKLDAAIYVEDEANAEEETEATKESETEE